MRPTGKLHLGNYMGALANWVKLQNDYDCYFFIADLHALTTEYADTSNIASNTLEVALDFLGAGLDPEQSTIFLQGQVKQHFELPLLLGMITPLGWLERVPTYKEMQDNLATKDLTTYGFLGYPVLMAADILLYQPQFVPVGQDQQAHVEITREISRRFNQFYKLGDQEVLPEPKVLLTPSPKLPGTDGRKMSKSYGNTIEIFGDEKATKKKVMGIVTDSQPVEAPKVNMEQNIPLQILKVVAPTRAPEVEAKLIAGGYGYGDAKKELLAALLDWFAPMRQKRAELAKNLDYVNDVLRQGATRANAVADVTMQRVRAAVGLR